MTETTKRNNIYIHVGIMLAFMFLFRFLPAPGPITPYGMQIIGIFFGLLYGWTFTGDLIMPSIFSFAAVATTEYGGGTEVLAGVFSNASVMMILFGSLLIGPLTLSGVGEYLMLRLLSVKFVTGKPWVLTVFLLIGLYVVDVVTANPMIVVLMVMGIFPATLKAAGYSPNDKYPNMLMMGITIGALMSCIVFPFMSIGLLPTGTLYAATGIMLNPIKWMIVIIPFTIVYLLGFTLLMKIMGCDASKMTSFSTTTLQEKYPNGLSSYQKAILIATAAMLVGSIVIAFGGFLGGSIGAFLTKFAVAGWLLLVPACMMFIHVDNKPLLTFDMVKQTFPWELFLCMGAAMFVAGCLTSQTTGVAALAGMVLGALYNGIGEFMFLLLAVVLCLVLTNFLNNIAITMTFLSVLCALYLQGILPNISAAVLVVSLAGMMGFLTPSGSVQGAMAHSFEFTTASTYYKTGIVAVIYSCITFGAILLPFALFVF